MQVFDVREKVVTDYRTFTEASVSPRARDIRAFLDLQAQDGAQWPDPWISLNPSFRAGGSIEDLVAQGRLHPDTAPIFRIKNPGSDPAGEPLHLHQHQADAIDAARAGGSYVLRTDQPTHAKVSASRRR